MNIQEKIDNADKTLSSWARSGQRPTEAYNKKYGKNIVHDSIIFDIILDANFLAKSAILSSHAYHTMYDELGITKRASQEQQQNGFNSYMGLLTYVLNMTERKFGTDSVQKNTKYSMRGFDRKPEVINYARMVCQLTLDRFEFQTDILLRVADDIGIKAA